MSRNHQEPNVPSTLRVDCDGQMIVTRRWGCGDKHAVILHGFPDDADSMALVGEALAAHGYTVWAPFLRGYAPSACAHDGRYDVTELTKDISCLLTHIQARECVLLGHDWGAVLAYAVSALGHHAVARVIGLSVPPVPCFVRAIYGSRKQRILSRYMLTFQVAGFAEARLRRHNFQGIESLWQQWSPHWQIPTSRIQGVKATFAQPGTVESALSYYRAARPGVSKRRRNNWQLMNARPTHPVICLVGQNDHCILSESFQSVEYPVHRVPDAGHFLPLEAPQAIVSVVLNSC